MAIEIADSDSESEDLVDQIEIEPPSLPRDDPGLNGIDPQLPPPNIDFGQSIDPTQKLSDLSSLLSRGSGSTEEILQGSDKARKALVSTSSYGNMNNDSATFIIDMDVSSLSLPPKRRQSAVEMSSTDLEGQPSKKKRAKTYSTKSKSASTQSTDLFADVALSGEQHTAPEMNGANVNELILSMEASREAPAPRERDRPRRVISLLKPAIMETKPYFSTSTSSMGGYESLNLDFRGSGQGLDINANPFDAHSQTSMNDVLASSMADMRDLYSNAEQADKWVTAGRSSPSFQFQREMMTSPSQPNESALHPEVLDPRTLMQDAIEDPSRDLGRPSKRRKTDTASSRATASPAPGSSRRAASLSVESVASDGPQPKKRGRKAKSSKPAASSPAPETEPTDVLRSMEPPPSRTKRSRQCSIDASSQASEASQPVNNTKRKTKNADAEDIREHSSPAKNPSSELNLSDEHAIGLPKEQYKPRPSRSRSKRSVDEGTTVAQPPTIDKHVDKPDPFHVADIETPKPVKANGKGKKSKVKRAKTSGMALKKSEPMLSDGEEDVLFMEQKPATVKLDLPPDLNVLKKEEEKKNMADVENENAEDEVKTNTRATKSSVTIEIPPPRPATPAAEAVTMPEPKKRGRKPKNPTPVAPTPEPLTDPDEDTQDVPTTASNDILSTPVRPPLKDRDTNTASIPAPLEPSATKAKDKGKENTTPSPSKPTPHSPLKTSSSVTTKVRYRVGLSKRHSIPGLLRRVDRTKKAPTKVATTVKERKVKAGDLPGGVDGEGVEDRDGEGDGSDKAQLGLRDRNGELIEWEF